MLAFIYTLDHPEMVGVNPEVAHEQMPGLDFSHASARRWRRASSSTSISNGQKPGRYDQDLRFASEDQKGAFFLVKLLEDASWAGMRHFDSHAYRTEDEQGVWDFAYYSMRSYLILKDKVARFHADTEIRDILHSLRAAQHGARSAASGRSFKYERKTATALKAHAFDAAAPCAARLRVRAPRPAHHRVLLGVRYADSGIDEQRHPRALAANGAPDRANQSCRRPTPCAPVSLFSGAGRRHQQRQGARRRRARARSVARAGEPLKRARAPAGLGGAEPDRLVEGGGHRDQAGRTATRGQGEPDRRDRDLGTDALVGVPRRRGRVIRPALLWCDGRTTEQCRAITARVGESNLRAWVSNPALEGFTLPKVLWLREERAGGVRKAGQGDAGQGLHPLLPDRQAGDRAVRRAGTLMYDVAHRRWSREMLDAMELDMSCSPTSAARRGARARVARAAATATGLAAGTPIVGGGADNACGAVGVGAVAPGEAVASWGTSGTVLTPDGDAPGRSRNARAHLLPRRPRHLVRDGRDAVRRRRVRLAPARAGARAGPQEERRRASQREAARIPPGAEGLTFLPYLQGERTPHRDAAARGAFVGLSLAHTRAHMTRAVLEGICFGLRDSLEIIALGSRCPSCWSPAAAPRRRSCASCRPTSTASRSSR